MSKSTVIIGQLGTTLDVGSKPERWNRWRPTISLFQHDDLLVDRLDLLLPRRSQNAAARVVEDIARLSPETTVKLHTLDIEDPWDFEEVYTKLQDFSLKYPFNPSQEDYLIHLTTGTHVSQICLFLLAEARYLPGRLVQSSPPAKRQTGPGEYHTIDLDLSICGDNPYRVSGWLSASGNRFGFGLRRNLRGLSGNRGGGSRNKRNCDK